MPPTAALRSRCSPPLTLFPFHYAGQLNLTEFVNADVIARGLSAFAPESVSIAAGRIMLARLHDLADQRRSFAFETTLATRSFAPRLRRLTARGNEVHLLFLWLPSPDLAVARVQDRVAAGGHTVPEDIIRRRYTRGLTNFFNLYQPLASQWLFYNNSDRAGPRLIAERDQSGRNVIADPATWEKSVPPTPPNPPNDPDHIRRLFRERTPIDRALRRAVQLDLLRHKREGRGGRPIVVWRDGKVVHIPPEEIEIDPIIDDDTPT